MRRTGLLVTWRGVRPWHGIVGAAAFCRASFRTCLFGAPVTVGGAPHIRLPVGCTVVLHSSARLVRLPGFPDTCRRFFTGYVWCPGATGFCGCCACTFLPAPVCRSSTTTSCFAPCTRHAFIPGNPCFILVSFPLGGCNAF